MVEVWIDQSAKWEESHDTVLGVEFSSEPGSSYAVRVAHREKTRLHSMLARVRQENHRVKKDTVLRMFSYAVFLAIRHAFRPGDVLVIDTEYDGHDDQLTDLLIDCFRRYKGLALTRSDIRFERVGKQALCHKLAITTWRGDRKPEYSFRAEDFLALMDRTQEIREKAFLKRKQNKR